MGVLDMNLSEIDVLKHACTNFIKINFKKLQHSPRYGKLGNVIYPDEFNTPFDIFKYPEKCVLFWGFGELPLSYQAGITELEVIAKISTPGQEGMVNRGDGLYYTVYNDRTRRIYPCNINNHCITIKDILDGNFE
jgi:hypothetical protein